MEPWTWWEIPEFDDDSWWWIENELGNEFENKMEEEFLVQKIGWNTLKHSIQQDLYFQHSRRLGIQPRIFQVQNQSQSPFIDELD
jgi:hypothetical protein